MTTDNDNDLAPIRIDAAAVRELDDMLRLALEHGDDPYVAKRLTLSAVVRFLLRHDRWKTAALPLVALENELPDLLLPNPGGRPAVTANIRLQGYIAASMDCLMKLDGMKKLEAARWVAERLTKTGWSVSPYTVIRWRNDARDPKNAALNRSYRDGTNPAMWAKKTAKAYAEEIISRVAAVHTPQQRNR